jgi:hypothetical protein
MAVLHFVFVNFGPGHLLVYQGDLAHRCGLTASEVTVILIIQIDVTKQQLSIFHDEYFLVITEE